MNGARNSNFFVAPHPGALGRSQKVKYHLISFTMSISKIFIPNFVCVLTNERYKTYQTGVLFYHLGHALGVGLGVLRGQKSNSVLLSVCYCTFFWPQPLGALGRGQKVKYHLISITKSISKIFIPNIVCVLTNERYKTEQTGFSFCCLGHAPGVGL